MFDIYKSNTHDAARFLLGGSGEPRLIVVGLNPSAASSEKSDTAVSKVKKVAENAGYRGFIMTNLYPLRSTDPHGLPENCNEQLLIENMALRKTLWNPMAAYPASHSETVCSF